MGDFKVNEDFANKYNKYREKEELQKLKSRYGDVSSHSDSSDSESEDENAEALTPGLERDFLRTLAYLKKKDPAIYDKSKRFYEDTANGTSTSTETDDGNTKSMKPMFLKDYERKVILENKGKFLEDESDNEENNRDTREASPSYHEEQIKLQKDIKRAVDEMIQDGDDEGVGLLVKRHKSLHEKEKDEEEFRKWLKTPQAKLVSNEENIGESQSQKNSVISEVAPLQEYWTDPDLNEGEKFLRDYILDRKYLDPNADEEIPTYDEIVGNGEELEESELFEKKAEAFEHKYNFRYEEPDQEFIKSYPRTIGTSVRQKEDKRKKKRNLQKVKAEEKNRKKQEELKQLKFLKKKEILDKIQKLQEATGNKDIEFKERDLEEDFNPEEHDKRMREIFDNYDEEFDEEKPVFSDLEDELEDYEKYWDDFEKDYQGNDNQPDCEDPDFIMDCDYDAEEHQKKKEEKKKRKNKIAEPNFVEKKTKKSPFYTSVSKPKPAFDPDEKSFEKYLDEYYALDYEDIIGDLPCRFKYRQVVPNDFGLSTAEILGATDKELNSWCSLKRAVQYRKEEDERRDIHKYRRKAKNTWKKARVLKSLYEIPGNEDSKSNLNEAGKRKKMNSRKRRRMKERTEKLRLLQDNYDEDSCNLFTIRAPEGVQDTQTCSSRNTPDEPKRKEKTSKMRKRRNKSLAATQFNKVSKLSDDRLKAYGLAPKKFLKKIQYSNGCHN